VLVTIRSSLLALVVACAACGTDATAPVDGPARIEATLALDLPMGDEDSVFVGALRDATRLADGRLAVLDGDRKAVLLLSSDGDLLATAGRAGAGPGEFQWPAWMGRCQADSLYVWDRGRSTVAIFAPEGSFVREFRPAVTSPFQPECLPDGRFVALDARAAADLPPGPNRGESSLIQGALVVMSPSGDSLTAHPDVVLGESKVFGAFAGLAVLPDRIVTGLNSSPGLERYSFAGTPLGRDSVPMVAVPYDDMRFAAMVDRQTGAVPNGDSTVRAMLREMLMSEGMPTHAPLFHTMHGAPDGTVWWVTSLPVDSVTTMLGVREGVPVQTLELPAGIEVFEVGADYLLGKRTDGEGFERLVLYRW
jgi:hypothetical protein